MVELARALECLSSAPAWLDRDALNAHLLGRDPRDARARRRAATLYAQLLHQARPEDAAFWLQGLRQQIDLGDAEFVARALAVAEPQRLRQICPRASSLKQKFALVCSLFGTLQPSLVQEK